MPMICTPHRDWLFYILYYGDVKILTELVRQCQSNILGQYRNDPALRQILAKYDPDASRDSLLVLRAKFFVLLHEDEYTRKELVQKPATLYGSFGPVPLPKANNFYKSLNRQVVPRWVSDEDVQLYDFIDDLRMAYLVA